MALRAAVVAGVIVGGGCSGGMVPVTNVTAAWCASQLTQCLYWDRSTLPNDNIARCIHNATQQQPRAHFFAQNLWEVGRNANISMRCFDKHHVGGVTFAGGFVPMLNTTPSIMPVTTETFSAYTCGANAVSAGDILYFCPNTPPIRRKKCYGMPACNSSYVRPRPGTAGPCCDLMVKAAPNTTAANFTYPILAEVLQRSGKIFGDNCKRLFANNVSVGTLQYKAPAPSGPPKASQGVPTPPPAPPAPAPIGGWFCGALWAYEHNDTLGGWSLYNQTDTGTPVAARYKFMTDEHGGYAGAIYSLVAIHDAPCYQQLIAKNNTPACRALLPQAFINCSDSGHSNAAATFAEQRQIRDAVRLVDAERAAMW